MLWNQILEARSRFSSKDTIPREEGGGSESLEALEEEQIMRGRTLAPRVTCCADGFEGIKGVMDGDVPRWTVFIERRVRPLAPPTWEPRPIAMCPWCGTRVPGFQELRDPEEHYARHEQGHCLECRCSISECFCLPAICGWCAVPAMPTLEVLTLSMAPTVPAFHIQVDDIFGHVDDETRPSGSEMSSQETSKRECQTCGDAHALECVPPAFLDDARLDQLISQAAEDPRRRLALLLHNTAQDRVQCIVNAFMADSYVQPHLFRRRVQFITILRGAFALKTWGLDGEPKEHRLMKVGDVVRLTPEVYHAFAALKNGSVLLELLAGPYEPETREGMPGTDAELTEAAKGLLASIKCGVRVPQDPVERALRFGVRAGLEVAGFSGAVELEGEGVEMAREAMK